MSNDKQQDEKNELILNINRLTDQSGTVNLINKLNTNLKNSFTIPKNFSKTRLPMCKAGQVLHSCKNCPRVFKDINNYREHRFQEHKEEYPNVRKCDLCSYATILKSKYDCHMKCHANNKVIQCRVCNYSTINIRHMSKHERSHLLEEKNVISKDEILSTIEKHRQEIFTRNSSVESMPNSIIKNDESLCMEHNFKRKFNSSKEASSETLTSPNYSCSGLGHIYPYLGSLDNLTVPPQNPYQRLLESRLQSLYINHQIPETMYLTDLQHQQEQLLLQQQQNFQLKRFKEDLIEKCLSSDCLPVQNTDNNRLILDLLSNRLQLQLHNNANSTGLLRHQNNLFNQTNQHHTDYLSYENIYNNLYHHSIQTSAMYPYLNLSRYTNIP